MQGRNVEDSAWWLNLNNFSTSRCGVSLNHIFRELPILQALYYWSDCSQFVIIRKVVAGIFARNQSESLLSSRRRTTEFNRLLLDFAPMHASHRSFSLWYVNHRAALALYTILQGCKHFSIPSSRKIEFLTVVIIYLLEQLPLELLITFKKVIKTILLELTKRALDVRKSQPLIFPIPGFFSVGAVLLERLMRYFRLAISINSAFLD